MSMPVADQAWTLLAALFLGNALALVFDALRALRRRLRTALGRCGLDVLFALITLAALFTFGMVTPLGRLQVTTLLAVALGALGYGVWLRPVFFPAFAYAAEKLASLSKWCGNHLKKVHFFCKNLFPKSEKWFTIILDQHRRSAEKGGRDHAQGQAQSAFQEGRHCYHPALPGASGVRNVYLRERETYVNAKAELRRLNEQAETMRQQVQAATEDNAALEYKIEHSDDPEIMEQVIREEFGYVKPGDKVFYDVNH